MRIRSAAAEDEAFLWEMLTHAASMPDAGSAAAIASAQVDPNLYGYVRGWGREGDLGVIAEGAERLGAAWVRAGRPGHAGGSTEPADEAELAIATSAAARRRGLGTAMLEDLIARARVRYRAMVLSVREGNPAIRVYERCGFVVEREIVNRVGTRSLAMRLPLTR